MKSVVSQHWRRLCKSSFASWWASQCLGCYMMLYSYIFLAPGMSAHIPPVKYRWCKLQTSEVMRTPLQILFLILVTDLPPSIALGMEPGPTIRRSHRFCQTISMHYKLRYHNLAMSGRSVVGDPRTRKVFRFLSCCRRGQHFEDAPTTQGLPWERAGSQCGKGEA